MGRSRAGLLAGVFLLAGASLACRRAPDSSAPAPSPVGDDVKDLARATQKAAGDIGKATADLAAKAGQDLEQATDHAGGGGQDAWITTRVKGALTGDGFDPLRVHVDTDGKVVTLSGTVESTAQAQRAVTVAKAINGVLGVKDHLFVEPARR
jgi:osmotically-inducible protein OsmY